VRRRHLPRRRHRATGNLGQGTSTKSSPAARLRSQRDPVRPPYQAGRARKIDYVIADTAGRLHTKSNLMAELEKMRRTAARPFRRPHEVAAGLWTHTGQNGLEQARRFLGDRASPAIVLTKLDGTPRASRHSDRPRAEPAHTLCGHRRKPETCCPSSPKSLSPPVEA